MEKGGQIGSRGREADSKRGEHPVRKSEHLLTERHQPGLLDHSSGKQGRARRDMEEQFGSRARVRSQV